MFDSPDSLPDTLADEADGLGPLGGDLGLEHGHARVHLGLAQHARVARRPLDDVGVADAVQLREPVRVAGRVPHRRDAGRVQQFPEQVRRVRVREPRRARHQAWVHSDEEEDQVRRDGVAEAGGRGEGGVFFFGS